MITKTKAYYLVTRNKYITKELWYKALKILEGYKESFPIKYTDDCIIEISYYKEKSEDNYPRVGIFTYHSIEENRKPQNLKEFMVHFNYFESFHKNKLQGKN